MKLYRLVAYALTGMLISCQNGNQSATICESPGLNPDAFGTAEVDGKEVKLYTLRNNSGSVAQFTNLGAKMVTLFVPDKDGKLSDVVLGYATAAEYAACDNASAKGEPFFGATIGRYGNRIAEGKFSIDGQEYQVVQNEGTNSLHGGTRGFYSQVWLANQLGDNKIAFKYTSPDGEMGYPGTLNATVTYELTDSNSVVITYDATTDKPTVINLTNHSFFNLNGEDDTSINDEVIRIAANEITPVDEKLIPTGELMNVENTPFDFRKGYDHNFVLSEAIGSNGLRFAAEVSDGQSGRIMRVYTSEPGIQFYAGNFLNGTQRGKCGKAYPFRSALCLETQHFPNTPNTPNFPSAVLRPGEHYNHVCVYAFSTK